MAEQVRAKRLDLAARAESIPKHRRVYRLTASTLTIFAVLLACFAATKPPEMLAIRAIACLWSITTIVLWANWRHGPWLLGSAFFITGLVSLFPGIDPSAGWVGRTALASLLCLPSFQLWTAARVYARVHGPDWRDAQSEVREWLCKLENAVPAEPEIIEIQGGSFWSGYFKYRLLRVDNLWAVTTYSKTWREFVEYHVYQAADVKVEFSSDNKLNVRMGNRNLQNATVSNSDRQKLLAIAQSS